MIKVKSHKRVKKNGVTVVKQHARISMKSLRAKRDLSKPNHGLSEKEKAYFDKVIARQNKSAEKRKPKLSVKTWGYGNN